MNKPDVLIIGSGIMGTSLAKSARSSGLSTLVIGGDVPASLAAVGIIRVSWLPTQRDKERTLRSLALYRENSLLLNAGALFQTSRKEPLTEKLVSDFYAVNVDEALNEPDIHETVLGIQDCQAYTALSGSLPIPNLCTFVATGSDSARFGRTEIAKVSYGATSLYESKWASTSSVRIHQCLPYQILARTETPTVIRIGSSTALHAADAVPRLRNMVKSSPYTYRVPGRERVLVGSRVYAKNSFALHWEDNYKLCRVYGFGKMGFALAPALAEELIQTIVKR